jgi:hypothetical protein
MDHPVLYELFLALAQDKKWPALGVGDYLLLPELLRKRNWRINNFDDLSRVCELLWMKNQTQQQHFTNVLNARRQSLESFIEAIKLLENTLPEEETMKQVAPELKTDPLKPPEPGPRQEAPPPSAPPPKQDEKKPQNGSAATEEQGGIEIKLDSDEDGVFDQTYRLPAGDPLLPLSTAFLLNNEYYPVTSRVLQQDWRKLFSRQQSPELGDVDIDRTIGKIAKEGFFLDVERGYKTRNRWSLFIFIDRSQGMDSFSSFGDELARSAQDSLLHSNCRPWYFTEAPFPDKDRNNGYILVNENQTRSTTTRHLFRPVIKRNRVVLIYSDAGVVQGSRDGDQRMRRLSPFLDHLSRETAYIAWINPSPTHRWKGTCAETIVNGFDRIPMYEATRQGFGLALSALKGKFTIQKLESDVA